MVIEGSLHARTRRMPLATLQSNPATGSESRLSRPGHDGVGCLHRACQISGESALGCEMQSLFFEPPISNIDTTTFFSSPEHAQG